MNVDKKDFQKLHFIIAKIAKDAKLEGTIQHLKVLDSVGSFRNEVNRVLFVERNSHGKGKA